MSVLVSLYILYMISSLQACLLISNVMVNHHVMHKQTDTMTFIEHACTKGIMIVYKKV